jgi:hypothetical protein
VEDDVGLERQRGVWRVDDVGGRPARRREAATELLVVSEGVRHAHEQDGGGGAGDDAGNRRR